MMSALSVMFAAGAGSIGAATCSAVQGQAYIDAGRYDHAIREFGCVIAAQPTEAEGYRGRIEAELLSGLYSDAFADYGRVTANVIPLHPGTGAEIIAHYNDRLAAAPQSISALTGLG